MLKIIEIGIRSIGKRCECDKHTGLAELTQRATVDKHGRTEYV